MTDDEHQKVYHFPVTVHWDRGDACREGGWERKGVKENECSTLCGFCHLGKHSIKKAVFQRDNFTCQDCGKKPEDNRLWFKVRLTAHRLNGCCIEEVGPDADPAGFITLCRECDEKRHPDKFEEYCRYGLEIYLPQIVHDHPEKFGIFGPITGRDQLVIYKLYLLAVNFFIDYFCKNGVPRKKDLRASIINLADVPLSPFLRLEAAKEAINQFGLTWKQREQLKKMTEEQKKVFMQERKDRQLDSIISRNAEPSLTFKFSRGSTSVQI
jgi:hypothetical protein